LQYAPLAAVNRDDAAAGGSREENPGVFIILEQRRAFINGIAFQHQHGGAHSDILFPKQGDMLNVRAILDRLNRGSGYRQI
jgi:hypothetical protein